MTALIDRLSAFPPQRLARAGRVYGYRAAGSGPTLVLLHGIGSGSGSWVQQLEVLSGRLQVIAWDAPGYGETTPLEPEAPSAADYAAALDEFLDGLGIGPCHLLGHSLGALMAAAFACNQPERVQSLILADPAIGYGTAEPWSRSTKLDARLRQMAQLGPEGLARERAPALLSAGASSEAVELVRWNMRQLHPAGYAQAARLLAGGNLLADVAGYRGRVLVMCGTEDRITPEADARRVAAVCADSAYRALPGAGHASYIESPELFNRLLLAFIEFIEGSL